MRSLFQARAAYSGEGRCGITQKYGRWEEHGVSEAAGVIIELFGIPRLRAGRAEATLPSGSVREVLYALRQLCPGLGDLLREDGGLSRHYLLSLEGQEFITDLGRVLPPGSRLLLLSADPGG